MKKKLIISGIILMQCLLSNAETYVVEGGRVIQQVPVSTVSTTEDIVYVETSREREIGLLGGLSMIVGSVVGFVGDVVGEVGYQTANVVDMCRIGPRRIVTTKQEVRKQKVVYVQNRY